MSDKINKLYDSLRELGQISPDQIPQEAIETISSSFELGGEVQSNSVALLARIANETTAEEFESALESGELPAISLSNEEMEAFNGGRKSASRRNDAKAGKKWCGRCW